MDSTLRILLLCDCQSRIAATIRDHIGSLEGLSRHRWYRFPMLGEIPSSVELNRFDVVVIHYTLTACNEFYLSARSRVRLANCRALKAIFIQDEYRHVNATISAIRQMDVKVLFTCVPLGEIEKVYSESALPGVRKVNVLTGYVPQRLVDRCVACPSSRSLLVGYRGRRVPLWLGSLGDEKYVIGERFRIDAERFRDLKCDISFREEDRLYGNRWIRFLVRCRAVLGVESGASVVDFTGDLQDAVEDAVSRNPTLEFEEVRERYLADVDGSIQLNQISPRCYEAAALRTVMVMYPGKYSGRLEAWRHYIPLAKDHGNMDEVVAALRDKGHVDEMTERAYREVALARENSYFSFVEDVDNALESAFEPSMTGRKIGYELGELVRMERRDYGSVRRRLKRTIFFYGYMFLFGWLLGWTPPEWRERIHGRLKWLYHASLRCLS